jgi:Flp pilus assembly protein TadD
MKITFSSLALGVIWCAAAPVFADMGKDAAPVKAAAGSKAESHIAEGIEHYGKGHWDLAKKHFLEAEKADPQSAEAHYDLAIALDKSGNHKGATEHFQRAQTLGKDNMEIQQSEILKKHLKMK